MVASSRTLSWLGSLWRCKWDTQTRGQHQSNEFSNDNDNAHSVSTIVLHKPERVDEEDEEAATEHKDHCQSSHKAWPWTPKLSLVEFKDNNHHQLKPRSQIPEDIINLKTLSSQLESMLKLSQSLQAQQASTWNTIHLLKLKVTELQKLVQVTQIKVNDWHEAHQAAIEEAIESVHVPKWEQEKERQSLTRMINKWKKGVEGKWTSVQEDWSMEKDYLCCTRDEWELKMKMIKDSILTCIKSHLSVIQQQDSLWASE